MWTSTSRRSASSSLRQRPAGQQEGYDLLFDGEVDPAVLESTVDNPPAGDPRFDQQPLTEPAAPSRKLLTCTRAGGRDHPAVAAARSELANVTP